MKATFLFLELISTILFSFAQNQGKIISKTPRPKAGMTQIYVYQPPFHLSIPGNIYASVVYESNDQYYYKIFPISKINGSYQFSFKPPVFIKSVIICIIDDKNSPVDNNNETGFVAYLPDSNGNVSASARISAVDLLSYYAQRILKLNRSKLQTKMISLYEEAFRLSPSLKNESSYTYYLTILYQEKKDAVKTKLLAYAKKMALANDDEVKWINAIKIYKILQMDKEWQALEYRAIKIYPAGDIAKSKFWDDFYMKKDLTEQSILMSMNDYFNRFKDTSANVKYNFCFNMLDVLFSGKEWSKFPKYEALMVDQMNLARLYNKMAWNLCGDQIDKQGNEMDIAKKLSKKALDIASERMGKLLADDKYDRSIQGSYNTFTDTYALILYKLGQFDSAFYYQNTIYQQGDESDISEIERYAIYAEKVKGPYFASQIISEQLLNGLNSPVMLEQLRSIYKQLGIPDSTYINVRDKSVKLAIKKSDAEIKLKFGTQKSKNFKLKNLNGEAVSLSSFKNKVVILDFWATWCTPCRASFPGMQKIVDKYKDDKEVVFLFIDTWEKKGIKEMQESASRFLREKGYTFQVLLDEKDKVVEDYKVDGIPSRFIIDKKGNIVFMGDTSNLLLEIENVKN